MMRREIYIRAAAIIIAIVSLNFLASRHFFRWDLTEKREYTLADSTKALLSGLDDIVTARIYFSRELPAQLVQMQRSLQDLLDEYRHYSDGKFRVEYINPLESPQTEMEVQMLGIPPVQLNVIQHDKQEVAKVYLGMSIQFGEKKEIIPLVDSLGNAEYLITSSILKVAQENIPVVAWWSGDEDREYTQSRELLEKRYKVQPIHSAEELQDIDLPAALVMIEPGQLGGADLKAIDGYLQAGGSLFVATDSAHVSNQLQVRASSSPIHQLLQSHGVTVEKNILADTSNAYAAFSGGYLTYQVPYPFWVMVRKEGFSRKSPITAQLEQAIFPWASSLKLDEAPAEEIERTILAHTTASAGEARLPELGNENKADFLSVSLDPEAAAQALQNSSGGIRPLAVLLKGALAGNYPDKKDATLLVVGNSRWLKNSFLKQFPANRLFFENAVDDFAMGPALIGIRSRAAPFNPIRDLNHAQLSFIKYGNIFLMPLLLLLAGFFGGMRRRKKRRQLKMIYAA